MIFFNLNIYRNVILVFEPLTDLHWMKDVVQLPKAIARLTRGTAHAIARPNHKQNELTKHIAMLYFGKEIPENYDLFENADLNNPKTSHIWYLEACKRASGIGGILILYNFFGSPRKGALIFKLNRWLKFKKATVILKSDGTLSEWINQKLSKNKKIYDYIRYFFIDQIICENATIYSDLKTSRHHLFSKIVYLPLCPFGIFNSQKTVPYVSRPNNFLFVGRVHIFQKGADFLLDTWIKISKKLPGWKLQMAGPCTEDFKKTWVEKLTAEKATDSVVWLSELNPLELVKCYNNSKIVVCTSRWDSGPIVISEAALSGCAFIGTAVGEIPVLLDGLPGLVNDIKDLGETMRLFANDPSIAIKQANELYNRTKDRNWDEQVRKIKI